ncbi:hypothetical protein GSI_11073 [Ganoderma sinense ZZ0214-1]|uniref:Transporter n=1 Tax=Ganoderma sinense ZZ0214-1 TaxID=1077348 RepID=A0A2G8RZ68_9APHY|nr:hypothetical protein GSI_11073 [Ganoderma sinense ZZ0214-1]
MGESSSPSLALFCSLTLWVDILSSTMRCPKTGWTANRGFAGGRSRIWPKVSHSESTHTVWRVENAHIAMQLEPTRSELVVDMTRSLREYRRGHRWSNRHKSATLSYGSAPATFLDYASSTAALTDCTKDGASPCRSWPRSSLTIKPDAASIPNVISHRSPSDSKDACRYMCLDKPSAGRRMITHYELAQDKSMVGDGEQDWHPSGSRTERTPIGRHAMRYGIVVQPSFATSCSRSHLNTKDFSLSMLRAPHGLRTASASSSLKIKSCRQTFPSVGHPDAPLSLDAMYQASSMSTLLTLTEAGRTPRDPSKYTPRWRTHRNVISDHRYPVATS